MNFRALLFLSLAMTALSCHPSHPGEGPSPSKRIEVSAWLEKEGVGRIDGAPLQSGDAIAIHLSVSAASYVYVIQFGTNGEANILFPTHDDLRVPANLPTRVPPEHAWLDLDETPGEEVLYVVAALYPLSEIDADLAGDIDRARSAHRLGDANYASLSAERSGPAGCRSAAPLPPLPAPSAPGPSASGVPAPAMTASPSATPALPAPSASSAPAPAHPLYSKLTARTTYLRQRVSVRELRFVHLPRCP